MGSVTLPSLVESAAFGPARVRALSGLEALLAEPPELILTIGPEMLTPLGSITTKLPPHVSEIADTASTMTAPPVEKTVTSALDCSHAPSQPYKRALPFFAVKTL